MAVATHLRNLKYAGLIHTGSEQLQKSQDFRLRVVQPSGTLHHCSDHPLEWPETQVTHSHIRLTQSTLIMYQVTANVLSEHIFAENIYDSWYKNIENRLAFVQVISI